MQNWGYPQFCDTLARSNNNYIKATQIGRWVGGLAGPAWVGWGWPGPILLFGNYPGLIWGWLGAGLAGLAELAGLSLPGWLGWLDWILS